MGLMGNYTFKNEHLLSFEIENRRFIAPSKQSTFLARLNYRIFINSTFSFSFGFSNFYQWSQNPYSKGNDFAIPEYRPHIDFYHQHHALNNKLTIVGRWRNEYRIFQNSATSELTNGFYGYFRTRYRILSDYLINSDSKNKISFRMGAEVHFNFGDEIIYNRFDQLRIITGINMKFNSWLQLGTEYIYWYQHRNSFNSYYQRNIFRLILNFTFHAKAWTK